MQPVCACKRDAEHGQYLCTGSKILRLRQPLVLEEVHMCQHGCNLGIAGTKVLVHSGLLQIAPERPRNLNIAVWCSIRNGDAERESFFTGSSGTTREVAIRRHDTSWRVRM